VEGAAEWLHKMAQSPASLVLAGGRSRQLAVDRFGIGPIATRFEEVLAMAVAGGVPAPHEAAQTAEAVL
jgi:hypothetical protein